MAIRIPLITSKQNNDFENRIVYKDFTDTPFTYLGKTRSVYRKGKGPAVIVLPEVPGAHPGVFSFAREVASHGFTVLVPSLMGTAGKKVTKSYSATELGKLCISREFTLFATKKTSPVTNWLRALARDAHRECGGPGVGVIGMCLTGGFALAMAADSQVLAPVISQPSLPIGTSKSAKQDLGVSDGTLQRVKQRVKDEELCVLGLRFSDDAMSPKARFQNLKKALGDGFMAIEIDSSSGNPNNIPKSAHSVLTHHLVNKPNHPTRKAADEVINFFKQKLLENPPHKRK